VNEKGVIEKGKKKFNKREVRRDVGTSVIKPSSKKGLKRGGRGERTIACDAGRCGAEEK